MTRGLYMAALLAVLVLSALSPAARADAARDALMSTATHLGYDSQAEAGLAVVRQVLAQYPDDVEARILEARLLAWAGRNDDAKARAARLRTDYPANADILTLAGDIAWYGGDVETAHDCYQKALSLIPDSSDALQGLDRTDAARKKRWRLDGGVDVSWFGRQGWKEWQDSNLRVGYALSDDTEIHAAGLQAHRYSLIDRYMEIGVDHRFLPWLRGYVAAGMTPDADFLPKSRFALGSAVRVRDDKGMIDATWLSLDWQHSAYITGTVSSIAPGIQQYLFGGQAWVTARALRVTDQADASNWGYEARVDWQALERWRLFAGSSNAPETTDNITAYTNSRFAGVVAGLTPDIDLTLSAARTSPWRKTVGAALSVRF